jgi:hypothetical protein
MQDPNTTQYILNFVERDIAQLYDVRHNLLIRRAQTDFQNLTVYSAINEDLTQNHGEILALARTRGRLEAMLEGHALNAELYRIINSQEGK